MVKAGAVFTFVAMLMLAVVPGAHAVSIVSDNTWNCPVISGCAGGVATAVSGPPIPPWVAPTTGTWITSQNATPIGLGTTVVFTKDIDFGTGGVLTFKVWADDTAAVVLSGSAINFLPNLSQDGACANGPIGCEPNEFGDFNSGSLTGIHTLTITVHQLTNNTPFGLLVEGDLAALAAVPEPATILLLGSVLAAAGAASRRFRKAETPKA